MKKRTRMFWISLALIAILLLATGPVSARTGVTTYEAMEYTCSQDPPAREWYSDDGTVWHVRGAVAYDRIVSDEPRVNGSGVFRGSFDLNLLTGSGRARGTAQYTVDGGTWQGGFVGVFTNWVYSGNGVFYGSHGLQGQALYMNVQQVPIPEDTPCPNGAQNAYRVFGVILDHRED